MLYTCLVTSNIISTMGVVPAGGIDILTISATLSKIIDYVRAWMPDKIEGQWIPIIAIGAGIGLCFLAGLEPLNAVMQGMVYGLAAGGMSSSTKATASASQAKLDAKSENKDETGKPDGDF
jgi:hypothetical protein